MAVFEWPCPACYVTQKSRAQEETGNLCASCEEKAQEEKIKGSPKEKAEGLQKAFRAAIKKAEGAKA